MSKIAIVYFSGYGHTRKQAEAVQAGAAGVAGSEVALLAIDAEGNLADADWAVLDKADAIVFGAPTYMGSVPWQFKKFADATSKAWYARTWLNKIAAGFTNSASLNGDKGTTVQYLTTLGLQHGMLWVGLGLLPSNTKAAQRNDINYLGASAALLAQSPSDASADEGPLPGDLETAKLFGARVAQTTARWLKGA